MHKAFRVFFIFIVFEILGIYQFHEQDVQKICYSIALRQQNFVQKIYPPDLKIIDLIEFLEGKDGDEKSEEDNYQVSSPGICKDNQDFLENSILIVDENPNHQLVHFKLEKQPLFILYQRWKIHIA